MLFQEVEKKKKEREERAFASRSPVRSNTLTHTHQRQLPSLLSTLGLFFFCWGCLACFPGLDLFETLFSSECVGVGVGVGVDL